MVIYQCKEAESEVIGHTWNGNHGLCFELFEARKEHAIVDVGSHKGYRRDGRPSARAVEHPEFGSHRDRSY
jgi:hypothetical protein